MKKRSKADSMRMKQHAARRRGFTLLELLVVISILGILIAILAPSLSTARAAAQSVVCKNNLRQIGMSMQMFSAANSNRWLNASGADKDSDADVSRWPVFLLSDNLLPTTPDTTPANVLYCPSENAPAPSGIEKWQYGGGYAFNNDLNTYGSGEISWDPVKSRLGRVGKRTDQVIAPSQYVTLWDSAVPLVNSSLIEWVFTRNSDTDAPSPDRAGYIDNQCTPDVERHRGVGNVLFIDAHSAQLAKPDFTSPQTMEPLVRIDHIYVP